MKSFYHGRRKIKTVFLLLHGKGERWKNSRKHVFLGVLYTHSGSVMLLSLGIKSYQKIFRNSGINVPFGKILNKKYLYKRSTL